jgi:glycosyltransferase involved in cell wall biosynthesis
MRVIFDISTVARRSGPPGGIGRVERELALHALKNEPDIAFSIYDHSIGSFRLAKREWVADIVGMEAILDLSRAQIRPAGKLKRAVKEASLWARRPRYNLQVILERARLTSPAPLIRKAASKLLVPIRSISSKRSRAGAVILPFEVGMGEPLDLGPDCLLASAGNDWSYKDPRQLAMLKEHHGFLYAALCHDLILIQFPELAGERTSRWVEEFWEQVFPICDLVVVTTKTVERDIREFCGARHLKLGATALVPLGSTPTTFMPRGSSEPPPGLQSGKYVLMVSSLERRKGHELIIRVWKKLAAEGIPQAHGFKMVFVGEHMFNTPHIKQMLRKGEAGPTLLHFDGISDRHLASFYEHAAFCIYPSQYEGYGLPAVEALAFGKALMTSTSGSIPEVVGDFALCLDPHNGAAWYVALKRWIEEPATRADYERKVQTSFTARTWEQTARDFFQAVRALAADRR